VLKISKKVLSGSHGSVGVLEVAKRWATAVEKNSKGLTGSEHPSEWVMSGGAYDGIAGLLDPYRRAGGKCRLGCGQRTCYLENPNGLPNYGGRRWRGTTFGLESRGVYLALCHTRGN
jgi:hypothetical protein